jgi:hypothetical protein
MVIRIALLLASMSGTLWAADYPFVGTWKVNPSKSTLIDQMKVVAVGPNKYAFTFEGTDAETIVANGTDQPGLGGTVLSVTAEGPNTWKVVRKRNGQTFITGTWNLSEDGNTLRDAFRANERDGSIFAVDYVYKRIAGTSGFAGTWESTTGKANSEMQLEIRPYGEDGLTFLSQLQKLTKNVKFDGKDYPNEGPNAAPGSASSARLVSRHVVQMTDKVKGKIVDTRKITLSPDLKTLTMTVYPLGQVNPNLYVFDRE